jgi:hypothetical protein
LPSAASVFDLAKSGSEDEAEGRLDAEIIQAKGAFGATPNLFSGGKQPPARNLKNKQAAADR